jgi:hypothetical protein
MNTEPSNCKFQEADASRLTALWEAHQQRIGSQRVLMWLLGAVSLGSLGSVLWQQAKSSGNVFADAKGKIDLYVDKTLAAVAVAPGTICAWPGQLPPDTDGWWEFWRVCDGGTSDKPVTYGGHEALWNALYPLYGNSNLLSDTGAIKLPDFRDYFLRGVGPSTATIGTSQPAALNGSDMVWTSDSDIQGARGPFRPVPLGRNLPTTGDEHLRLVGLAVAGENWHGSVPASQDSRPKNYPVHWVIRIK